MNTNYPYSYLHNNDNGGFVLSVVVQDIQYAEEQGIRSSANDVRWIHFDATQSPSDRLAPKSYALEKIKKSTIEVSTLPLNGHPIVDKNRATLHSIDFPFKSKFPNSLDFLPHIYLVKFLKEQFPNQYKLFIAVPHSGSDFDLEIGNADPAKRTRTIKVVKNDNIALPGIWTRNTELFAEDGAEIIEVIVTDTRRSEVGKGTVRHSAADNKPFDIIDCKKVE